MSIVLAVETRAIAAHFSVTTADTENDSIVFLLFTFLAHL